MSGQRGFTLVEVMLALAVLAIALPVLLGLRNRDVVLLDQAEMLTKATLLAKEKAFETELMGFPPLGEQSGDFAAPPPGAPLSADSRDRAPGFRWTRTVAPTALDPIREVKIRLTWPRGAGEGTLAITRYAFAEPGTSGPRSSRAPDVR
jgi:general secretion pathway protein I